MYKSYCELYESVNVLNIVQTDCCIAIVKYQSREEWLGILSVCVIQLMLLWLLWIWT